jgi:hypothetical protein
VIDLLDEQPEICPGCGTPDKPLADGPSALMPIYCPTESVVWCLECNMKYSAWLANQYVDAADRYKWRPDGLKNIHRIRNNEEPVYADHLTVKHPWRFIP